MGLDHSGINRRIAGYLGWEYLDGLYGQRQADSDAMTVTTPDWAGDTSAVLDLCQEIARRNNVDLIIKYQPHPAAPDTFVVSFEAEPKITAAGLVLSEVLARLALSVLSADTTPAVIVSN